MVFVCHYWSKTKIPQKSSEYSKILVGIRAHVLVNLCNVGLHFQGKVAHVALNGSDVGPPAALMEKIMNAGYLTGALNYVTG